MYITIKSVIVYDIVYISSIFIKLFRCILNLIVLINLSGLSVIYVNNLMDYCIYYLKVKLWQMLWKWSEINKIDKGFAVKSKDLQEY
jgi:hypothetical protein